MAGRKSDNNPAKWIWKGLRSFISISPVFTKHKRIKPGCGERAIFAISDRGTYSETSEPKIHNI
jgi:hypothetical protein